ncbi:MAG: DNA polymerase III subunit delta, partial [Chloroflexota bacterium]|nr:DNA polymerase III subunit delta [Chloroflexota bacterium]
MLYVLYGTDEFSLGEELARIKDGLDSGDMLSSNTDVLDGREATPEQLMAICDTVPFLSAHRLVVVEGLLRRFNPPERSRRGPSEAKAARRARSEGPELERWLALSEYVGRLPQTSTLILVDGELSASNPLFQALRPHGKVQEFRRIGQKKVVSWLLARAQKEGVDISPPAAQLLADLVGDNLRLLVSELEKLATYAYGRRIEGADVKALVSEARDVNIFAMVDAIAEKRPAVALRLLRRQIEDGRDAGYLFAMVIRQYRFIIQAKELMLAGLPAQEIGQRLEIGSDFVLQRVLDQAQRYSLPRLKAAYRRLLEADVGVKRGRYEEDLALELLVHDLARA